ncbi:MAG: hypothetical protein KKB21_02560 [Nanoarchaeota archaeon]|nr:hypothetical protein [Nanoarchaeota archaeon]MBU4086438.1 hypothetical protein [Nanoarchaeota archaeon]
MEYDARLEERFKGEGLGKRQISRRITSLEKWLGVVHASQPRKGELTMRTRYQDLCAIYARRHAED